jgi:hypothetical protein
MNGLFEVLPQHILHAKDVKYVEYKKLISVMKDVCEITNKQIDVRIENSSKMFDKFIQTCKSSDVNHTKNQNFASSLFFLIHILKNLISFFIIVF